MLTCNVLQLYYEGISIKCILIVYSFTNTTLKTGLQIGDVFLQVNGLAVNNNVLDLVCRFYLLCFQKSFTLYKSEFNWTCISKLYDYELKKQR